MGMNAPAWSAATNSFWTVALNTDKMPNVL